jgi:hypothetical protein
MRRIPAALVILALLAGTSLPARASESPPRSPSIKAAQVFGDLWDLLVSLFADLGSTMDPNGATAPQGDLGSEMDPDG